MLRDSLNTQLLDAFETNYQQRMSKDDKRGYREASINIHNVRQLNDSVTIVNYSNSFNVFSAMKKFIGFLLVFLPVLGFCQTNDIFLPGKILSSEEMHVSDSFEESFGVEELRVEMELRIGLLVELVHIEVFNSYAYIILN